MAMCSPEEHQKAKTHATKILGKNPALRRALVKRAKKTMSKMFTPEELAELQQYNGNGSEDAA